MSNGIPFWPGRGGNAGYLCFQLLTRDSWQLLSLIEESFGLPTQLLQIGFGGNRAGAVWKTISPFVKKSVRLFIQYGGVRGGGKVN